MRVAKSELKKNPKLEQTIKELKEEFGDKAVQRGDEVAPLEFLSTGVSKLDEMIGGGWVKGKISELWGPKSSGKSTMAQITCATVLKSNPKSEVAYFDLENGFDPAWGFGVLGIDPKRFWRISAIPAEGVMDLVVSYIKKEWPLVVIDSVIEMLPKKVLQKRADEETYAPVAKILSANLPKLIVLQTGSPTSVLLLNQVRDKMGVMFGSNQGEPGGKALAHLQSLLIRVQRKSAIENQNKQLGIETALKVLKSRVGQFEGNECRIAIMKFRGIVEDLTTAGVEPIGEPTN